MSIRLYKSEKITNLVQLGLVRSEPQVIRHQWAQTGNKNKMTTSRTPRRIAWADPARDASFTVLYCIGRSKYS